MTGNTEGKAMQNDYTVNVLVYNQDTRQMEQRSYYFAKYCKDIGYAMKVTLSDVEDAFIDMQGGRENWDEKTRKCFARIRSRILDCANNTERLPGVLCYKGRNINALSGGEYISALIDK